ncbi:RagB/SusD family nutrient uptake outer membrane protein [Aliifodinibius sp. S!AR15-10]|uniref:RagB/SusD family nutrient uptake outer membrane protein n=1 Tax=Aliifodinibius sp. S!AR15-10 TaxID=2950437 RepID=UPI0028555297|nr:RagB/SusD family nutrient uptake outer membrane protein [Aliifodinibius sp. S!AR15-10]MDR8392414.1 RagB/SusD family nutrient uptake outer membrane protein [Aliifodinibius sp. S!AR15-10]
MKFAKKLFLVILFAPLLVLLSCENMVEPEVYSQLDPTNVMSSEKGIKGTLNAAYAEANHNQWNGHSILNMNEMTTDTYWDTGGGENRILIQMINFTWGPDTDWFNSLLWNQPYRAIRNANTVLDNIDQATVSDELKNQYIAEARFIRALSYYRLYTWFGPVPLRTSTEGELEIPRAPESELLSFIETEFQEAIPDLPEVNQVEEYGRAHKSAARGYLTLFYLNTKQWQDASDMAQTIIDNGHFQLVEDYSTMFHKDGELNSEFIWANYAELPAGNIWINGSFPPGFRRDPQTGLTWTNSMNNWATQYRIYDSFYNTFDQNDERLVLILEEYENQDGEMVSLRDNDDYRALKYFDPNASANNHGTDRPTIRYAEILLARAEALNELNGPNQESIDLINEIRDRAELNDVSLADFANKEELRDQILAERGWEFYAERKRRIDLIRMGKFVEQAQNRGATTAQDFHRRYPIPQPAMDANPQLEQNPGY